MCRGEFMPLTFEEIENVEKTCLHRVETTMSYEKDPNIQRDIGYVGKALCRCIAEHSANPTVLHRVMAAATRATSEMKKITWSGNDTHVSDKLRNYAMKTFGIEIKEPQLTEDEKILLCKIRESERIAELQKGKIRKPTDFEVDEEFSRLCSKQFE